MCNWTDLQLLCDDHLAIVLAIIFGVVLVSVLIAMSAIFRWNHRRVQFEAALRDHHAALMAERREPWKWLK